MRICGFGGKWAGERVPDKGGPGDVRGLQAAKWRDL